PGGEVAGGTRGRRQALPDAAARPPGGGRGPDRHPGTPGADVPAPTGREGTETETEIDCHPGGGIMTANQFELRELHRGDAERCAELERVLFPGDNPWPRDVFVVEFSHPTNFYIGAFDDDHLVAYAGLAMMGPAEDPEFEIHTIGVDPD